MIARIWHGRTTNENADAYLAFLRERAISDYRSTPGNLRAYVLRANGDAEAHFLTFTLWDSLDSIRAFAGDEIERAKYYPEDKEFLLEFEPVVRHYEVFD
jgi:heme-degrading monooxygenase HmoA